MREIKFRVWDKSSKKMGMVQVRQMLIPDGNNENGLQELAVSGLKFNTNPSHWLITPPLMQYTGLKDKNGKEIYEGDILTYKDPNFEPTNVAVEWGDCGFILRWLWDNAISLMTPYPNHQFEVIGNIYENPELLKERRNRDVCLYSV